jgi:hypothetical protein
MIGAFLPASEPCSVARKPALPEVSLASRGSASSLRVWRSAGVTVKGREGIPTLGERHPSGTRRIDSDQPAAGGETAVSSVHALLANGRESFILKRLVSVRGSGG